MEILSIIVAVIATILGVGIGYVIRKSLASKQAETAEARAKKLIDDAKAKEKELLLAAKDKAFQIVEKAEKESRELKERLLNSEKRIEKREEFINEKLSELDKKEKYLEHQTSKIKQYKKHLEDVKREQVEKLQKVAGLSKEKARNVLLEMVEKDMKDQLLKKLKKLEQTEREELDRKAKELIIPAIQRCAASQSAETTTTTVSIPSDEMKGRIIGREGRNIKVLEQLLGVEIVVDDTPEAVVISGFSPVRRHVAKVVLEKLIQDGRIHPSRIEEAVEYGKQEIANQIREAGEAACYEVGVAGLNPKLVQLIGRLKFRTSYGQNVLRHSIEVAHIGALLAEELGADVALVKKAGILHDIGKAVDHEIQGTHIEIGRNILKKFGVSEDVIKAIQSHHEDYPYESKEAMIVQAADAISASRPGARKDTYEDYIKRLEELEKIANSFEGVEKSYAIQAGREIRVFVTPEKVDDLQAAKLSRKIADKIEEELKYPGEIKVNVIRETRAVDYAR